MKRVLLALILLATLFCLGAFLSKDSSTFYTGANLVGTSKKQTPSCYDPLLEINANSVSIVPFSYGNSSSGELTIHTNWQWWGESPDGSKSLAKMAKDKGLHVMIKPQVWFDGGTFTGDVSLDSDEKWMAFEKRYEEYIVIHAKNAEEVKADILCIGTELREFVLARPQFWSTLIDKVRKIYSGKLTYAGNWDSYKYIPFWNKLDFIGVDAYFPLSESKTPTIEEVKNGWKPHIKELSEISSSWGKQILFCEFGYRSTSFCAKSPWDSNRGGDINAEAQSNCFKGLFESVWKEPFMAGGFIWKWYPDHSRYGGSTCNRFTPQNKPTEKILQQYFSNEK